MWRDVENSVLGTYEVNKKQLHCLSVSNVHMSFLYGIGCHFDVVFGGIQNHYAPSCEIDRDRLEGFTHYTTRVLRNSAMPGSLTPRDKGTVYWR